MPTNPLTPQYRTDKNGRVVLRHVRADQQLSGTSFPPPAMPGSTGSDALVRNVMALVGPKLIAESRNSPDEVEAEAKATLSSYPDEVLVLLERALKSASRSSRAALCRMIQRKADPIRVHECARFLPDLWSEQAMNSLDSILSLHEYSQLPDVPNFALADEKTQQQCIALMNVTETVDGYHDFVMDMPMRWVGVDSLPVITDEKLVDLVLANPDKARMITEFIADRKSLDYEQLKELVETDSPSLSSGLL